MNPVPKEVEEMVAGLIGSFHRDNLNREKVAAEADPLANKLSRVFKDSSYRYFPMTNKKGQRVLFCYSVHRNVAGFFLGWRETHLRNGKVKRDMWLSRRVRKRCVEIARSRRDKLNARLAAKLPRGPLV